MLNTDVIVEVRVKEDVVLQLVGRGFSGLRVHLGLLLLQLRKLDLAAVKSSTNHNHILSSGSGLQRDHGAPAKVGHKLLIILTGTGQQLV